MIVFFTDKPGHPKDLTTLFVFLGAGAIACLGVVPLFGLPGAAILGASLLVLNPLISASAWAHLTADVFWLLSLIVSVLWPIGILPGYWIAFRHAYRRAFRYKFIIFVAVVTMWNLAVSAALLLSR